MAEFPVLPIFTDAFLADTLHLNAAQTGAYFLLLMCAWRSKTCDLPDDDDVLCRFTRMEKRAWLANKDTVMAFWHLNNNGRWEQKRLTDERGFAEDRRAQASQAGKASALKRKGRHSTGVGTETQPKRNHPTLPLEREDKSSLLSAPKKGGAIVKLENEQALKLYNEMAERVGLPLAQVLNAQRSARMSARLKDCGGIEGWRLAMEKVEASDFLCGRVKKFKASLDFILREESFIKLMEGNYDNGKRANGTKNNGAGDYEPDGFDLAASKIAARGGGPLQNSPDAGGDLFDQGARRADYSKG